MLFGNLSGFFFLKKKKKKKVLGKLLLRFLMSVISSERYAYGGDALGRGAAGKLTYMQGILHEYEVCTAIHVCQYGTQAHTIRPSNTHIPIYRIHFQGGNYLPYTVIGLKGLRAFSAGCVRASISGNSFVQVNFRAALHHAVLA